MRRPLWILVAAGVLTFALGVGAALLTNELANPHANFDAGEQVVMTEDCLNCHSDVFREAERAVQPMTIQSPVAQNLAAAAVGARAETLTVVALDEGARPYAITDPEVAPVRAAAGRVLLRTEDGVTVLPDVWSAYERMGAKARELCDACHMPTPTPALPGGV
ncbi:MAG: hypothetical protein U0452_05745 [Anaerolineae bacterium]